MVVIALVTGVLLLLTYKWTSQQAKIKDVKRLIKANFLAIALYKESLRVLAQSTLQQSEQFSHPYFWAPFTIVGDASGPLPSLPAGVAARWPDALAWLAAGGTLGDLAIDQRVTPVAMRGGETAARAALDAFVANGLPAYAGSRNHPQSAP